MEFGNTKVICAASLDNKPAPFLKNTGKGWLTAEYSMLPMSTQTRTARESSRGKVGGRMHEIQRLIGRSLRAVTDINTFGERTIYIDCDVLQADGGTRTACITGSCLALRAAVDFWLKNKIIRESIIKDSLASISVGVVDGVAVLDLSYEEDSRADADFNFVITASNKIVEIQGASEGNLVSWEQFEQAKELACFGVGELLKIGDNLFESNFNDRFTGISQNSRDSENYTSQEKNKNNQNYKAPLFSLGNRQNTQS